MGKESKREGVYVYGQQIQFSVEQELTQYSKAIIL